MTMMDMDKFETHSKRYELCAERLKEHVDIIRLTSSEVTTEDYQTHIEMMSEGMEALVDIIKDYQEALTKYQIADNTRSSALRLYGNEFGNHFITKKDMPDGTRFNLTVTLNQIDDETVEVILDSKVLE